MKNTKRKSTAKKEETTFEPVSTMSETQETANKSKNKFWYLLFGAVIIYAGYKLLGQNNAQTFKNKTIPEAVKKVTGPDMKIKEITDIKKKSGVYEFKIAFEGAVDQKYTSYITTDGKILFQNGIDLSQIGQPQAQTTPAKKLTCEEVNKNDNAKLTAFVVADCPYGLQMQRVLKVALAELPQLGEKLTVKYIGAIVDGKITSMHGDKEAQENLRQICIREEQPASYWPYVSCYMKEGKSDSCLSLINKVKLTGCIEDKNRGLKFAQVDFDLANKFKIGGSPTLLVNDTQIVSEFDFGGRTPDAIKQLACCGNKEKPSFCAKEISKDGVAASYSLDDKVAGDSTSATGCGN